MGNVYHIQYSIMTGVFFSCYIKDFSVLSSYVKYGFWAKKVIRQMPYAVTCNVQHTHTNICALSPASTIDRKERKMACSTFWLSLESWPGHFTDCMVGIDPMAKIPNTALQGAN